MKIHKESAPVLKKILIVFLIHILFFTILSLKIYTYLLFIIIFAMLVGFILFFFRIPNRRIQVYDDKVVAPADGTVVVIEEMEEQEYFHDKRLQISIFMSVWNVHINWFPVKGTVIYRKYHPGKFLVARNPKSSLLNERTTVVMENNNQKILFRQIAGAVARRIVNNTQVGEEVHQGREFGFIKFGSRVDVILPLGTIVDVKLNQKTVGGQTVIATLNKK